jgi:hypothetical protein
MVVDAMNFRVQVLDRSGQFQYAVGKFGDESGAMFRPKGIGFDSEGDLYVVDGLWGVVQVFNRQGELLYYFGERGTACRASSSCRHWTVHRPQRPDLCSGFVQSPRAGFPLRYGLEEAGQGRRAVKLKLILAGHNDDAAERGHPAGADYGDVIGTHDLTPGSKSPITGARPDRAPTATLRTLD